MNEGIKSECEEGGLGRWGSNQADPVNFEGIEMDRCLGIKYWLPV